MEKVRTGPPPAGLTDHGLWEQAQAAGVRYGDPDRKVWIRNSDLKMWEADDGNHLGGQRVGVRDTSRLGAVPAAPTGAETSRPESFQMALAWMAADFAAVLTRAVLLQRSVT